jgi:hypothetical protein
VDAGRRRRPAEPARDPRVAAQRVTAAAANRSARARDTTHPGPSPRSATSERRLG